MTDSRPDYWNRRHAEEGTGRDPSRFIVESAEHLPPAGTALDVAGGTGRHALWLAERGLAVTLVDFAEVALELARAAATSRGLGLELLQRDLEVLGLPEGRWDVVVVVGFLDRDVLQEIPEHLHPGGIVLIAHSTVRNLERHERPGRRHLLDEGELERIARAWEVMEILSIDEGWSEDRHQARLRARRV